MLSQEAIDIYDRALALVEEDGTYTGESLELFERAAAADHPKALLFAAEILMHPYTGSIDRERALSYFKRSAHLKESAAILRLGCFYMEGGMGPSPFMDNGEVINPDIPKDKEKGIDLLQEAAELGEVAAMIILAQHFMEQETRSISDALHWYEQGVAYQHTGCMLELGDHLAAGKEIHQDLQRAKALYEDALKIEQDPLMRELIIKSINRLNKTETSTNNTP